jgi:hypothetical protein
MRPRVGQAHEARGVNAKEVLVVRFAGFTVAARDVATLDQDAVDQAVERCGSVGPGRFGAYAERSKAAAC